MKLLIKDTAINATTALERQGLSLDEYEHIQIYRQLNRTERKNLKNLLRDMGYEC